MPKPGNGRRRPYQPEIAGKNNTIRRLKSELNRVQKKLTKLLARREAGLKVANQQCNQKGKDKQGQDAVKRVSFKNARLQGIAPDSERHNKLKSYIQLLKNQIAAL